MAQLAKALSFAHPYSAIVPLVRWAGYGFGPATLCGSSLTKSIGTAPATAMTHVAIVEKLDSLKLEYPTLGKEELKELEQARQTLLAKE